MPWLNLNVWVDSARQKKRFESLNGGYQGHRHLKFFIRFFGFFSV